MRTFCIKLGFLVKNRGISRVFTKTYFIFVNFSDDAKSFTRKNPQQKMNAVIDGMSLRRNLVIY